MMMNFIKGIIYDTFFILKDNDDAKEKDKKFKCFVCGLEREEIESVENKNFKFHILYEHNL